MAKMSEIYELKGMWVKVQKDSNNYGRSIWIKTHWDGDWLEFTGSLNSLIEELQKAKEWWNKATETK